MFQKGNRLWANEGSKKFQFKKGQTPWNKQKERPGLKDIILKEENKPSFFTAYILGVLEGDGCLTGKGRIKLGVKDYDFICYFKKAIEKTFKIKTPSIKHRKKETILSFELTSWQLFSFFKNFDLEKLKLKSLTRCGFLKGFFDSEGSIGGHSLECYNTNIKKINFVSELLTLEKIKHNIQIKKRERTNKCNHPKILYRIVISNFENKTRYSNQIGFSIKRKKEKLDSIVSPETRRFPKFFNDYIPCPTPIVVNNGTFKCECGNSS